MNLFDYIGEKYQLKDNARILQFASLSFDASVLEIFGALVNNSQLVIAVSYTHLYVYKRQVMKVAMTF